MDYQENTSLTITDTNTLLNIPIMNILKLKNNG